MLNAASRAQNEQETPKIISILIADDHPFIREALRILLQSEADMQIVAEASNGLEALEMAGKIQPDVIIMDIGMPVMNGLEATRQIKIKYPKIAILVLTVFTDNQHIFGILNAGAAGYLTKEVFGDDVIRGIRSIIAGEAVLTHSILQQIIKSTPLNSLLIEPATLRGDLTPREFVVFKLMAKGLCNKDIANHLQFNVRTVKAHLTSIFNKLEVSSRTEAVVMGLKRGLLTMKDLED